MYAMPMVACSQQTVTIASGTGPTAVDITPTDAACNQNNGAININGVTGGASPYEYNVDNGGYSGTLIIQISLQAITLLMYAMLIVVFLKPL
jgi:hypothetical protein